MRASIFGREGVGVAVSRSGDVGAGENGTKQDGQKKERYQDVSEYGEDGQSSVYPHFWCLGKITWA